MTAWRAPHRGWGEAHALWLLPEDARVLGFRQSLRYAERIGRLEVNIDLERSHEEVELPWSVADALHARLTGARVELLPSPPQGLGLPHHGLSIEVGYLSLSLLWWGRREEGPALLREATWMEGVIDAALDAR